MSSNLRQPFRIAAYTAEGSYYPRELVEANGELYLINTDGSKTRVNPSEITKLIDSSGTEIGSIDPTAEDIIELPEASVAQYGLVKFSTTAPKANGTAAAVGTAATAARSDHVHPLQTNITGNAGSATKLATARNIDGVSFDGSDTVVRYAVCSTAAATVEKTVTVDNFKLVEGAFVIIKFTNANSAANPTLNVSGTGAKPIYRYGTTAVSTGTTSSGWNAGCVQTFVYDGTGWIREYWYNTTYSNVSLGHGYATCSTAAATVAKVGTLSSYTLATGGIVAVKFTNAVPASATLNINSKGAKAIYYRGAAIIADVIKAGDLATFIYNGSQYHLLSIDRWQVDIDDIYSKLSNTETWTFTLEDGSTVTKNMVVK